MKIIEEFDKYLAEENSDRVGSYAMRTVENFVQWAESRGYLSAVQQSVQSDKCPHCQHGLIVLQDKSIIDHSPLTQAVRRKE